MPIAQFLDSSEFDPETKRVMAVAFEMARAALQLGDQSILRERIAKKIIELTKTGELNPDVLCEAVLNEHCQQPVGGGRLWRSEFVETFRAKKTATPVFLRPEGGTRLARVLSNTGSNFRVARYDVGDGSCSICGMLIFRPHKSDGMPASSSPCA